MAKHTHRGSCQICGHLQAYDAKDGTLAIHGYKVDYNEFVGECPGSRNKPYEHSCDLIPPILVHLRNQEATMLARIERERLNQGPIVCAHSRIKNRTALDIKIGRFSMWQDVDFNAPEMRSQYKLYNDEEYKRYIVAQAVTDFVCHLEKRLKSLQMDIKITQERLDTWKPDQPLLEAQHKELCTHDYQPTLTPKGSLNYGVMRCSKCNFRKRKSTR